MFDIFAAPWVLGALLLLPFLVGHLLLAGSPGVGAADELEVVDDDEADAVIVGAVGADRWEVEIFGRVVTVMRPRRGLP